MFSWAKLEGINDVDEEIDDAVEHFYYDEESGQYIDSRAIAELIAKELLDELKKEN